MEVFSSEIRVSSQKIVKGFSLPYHLRSIIRDTELCITEKGIFGIFHIFMGECW
jgi:hypothetical protein